MIVPTDKDYKETKLIKEGRASINPDFKPLADWIDGTYKVSVLNIYYDAFTGAHGKRFPRLNIIFEELEDELKFREGYLGNFHSAKQDIIAKKFDELVNGEKSISISPFFKSKIRRYEVRGLLVVFDAFKPVARDETKEFLR